VDERRLLHVLKESVGPTTRSGITKASATIWLCRPSRGRSRRNSLPRPLGRCCATAIRQL